MGLVGSVKMQYLSQKDSRYRGYLTVYVLDTEHIS